MAKNDFKNSPFEALKNIDRKELPKGTPYMPPPSVKASINQHPADKLPEKRSRTTDAVPILRVRKKRTDYDEWLKDEPPEVHNPNPFDFVFFSGTEPTPTLFSLAEIEQGQDLYSGYLEVELKALTPLHIVGTQIPAIPGHKISKSLFYKEDNGYCIPGSSIRGMLRAFIETLTNGCVSQAQENPDDMPAYPKDYGKNNPKGRHIGFDSFKVTENTHGDGSKSNIGPAIPPVYRLDRKKGMDIATYLMGAIISEEKSLSRRHKIRIEDAVFPENFLCDCKMIDIYDKEKVHDQNEVSPFMGGAHPSASNWWYMVPKEIRQRLAGGIHHVIEMIGEGFWGRKFYFHQDPNVCSDFYLNPKKDSQKWQSDHRRPIYEFTASCLDKEKPVNFRIDVERLPKPILDLLCICLMPGANIRHKLGYGKQYGYGSVEFTINRMKMRNEKAPLDLNKEEDWEYHDYPRPEWKDRDQVTIRTRSVIDEEALTSLARILGWADVIDKPDKNILCTYPPNSRGYFQTPIRFKEDYMPLGLGMTFPIVLSEADALKVAKDLWDKKRTIHFLLYQARAKEYNTVIMKRMP